MAGQRLQQYVRDTMTAAARRARVDIRPTLRLFGADPTAVFLQDVLTVRRGGRRGRVRAGAGPGARARRRAPRRAGGRGEPAAAFEVIGAGDVLSPRTIEEAVLEGLRAGVAI